MRRFLVAALAIVCAQTIAAHADKRRGIRSVWSTDLPKAVGIFEDALRDDPNDADAATNLGAALARLGKRERAADAFRQAIRLAPTRWNAYAALAELEAEDPRRWERSDELLALLKEGLRRVSGDAAAEANLAIATARLETSIGRTQAARARLEALDVVALSPEQHRRVLDLLESIRVAERAHALEDWPEPEVPVEAKRALARAEEELARGEAQKALADVEPLIKAYPGSRAAHWLRARCLDALGRWDAERELTVLVQLAPSHAEGWRRLGTLLATHGGALDADRADEALKNALALEPGWWDLWLVRAQVALRAGRPDEATRALERYRHVAPAHAHDAAVSELDAALAEAHTHPTDSTGTSHPAPTPSDDARRLYREAERDLADGDPLDEAPDKIAQALADSPAFVDAAVTSFALTGQVPEQTVRALWDDGVALAELGRKLRALGPSSRPEVRDLVRPWLDRAVELGVVSARFDRAQLHLDDGDRAGGVADLVRYVAAEPAPARLDEARDLLASLARQSGHDDPAPLGARLRLVEDRPEDALDALGGRCDAQAPASRLVPLGMVAEWSGDDGRAIACYREALARNGADRRPLARLATVAAHAPLAELAGPAMDRELARAAAADVPAAEWAIARKLLAAGDREAAMPHVERFLARAGADDPDRAEAEAARRRIVDEHERAARRRLAVRLLAGGAATLLALVVLLGLLHGAPLARALQRRPALYPDVARAIGELRHDVLKHRTSVIGLVAAGSSSREEVARVLCEPERASDLVAAAYEKLRDSARARGVTLRRLAREPSFGPLVRDLRRAEALVRRRAPREGDAVLLGRIDARLRAVHSERLGALLKLGPRTPVDAAAVSGWVRDVEREVKARGGAWTAPVLELHGLELQFPVERAALATVFTNLLRNAQAAVASEPQPAGGERDGGVLVRLGEERDETGRRLMVLLVGDSSPKALSLETIEGRESGRGLAIVRDLVHEWRGHLVVRPSTKPWKKGVGACFPT